MLRKCPPPITTPIAVFGFTLAEVLITLGIIGVVAAITITNLVSNYQKKVTVERLKFAYNIFSNVIEQAQKDYGNPIVLPETLPENIEGYNTYISATYFEPYLKDVRPYPTTKRIYVKTPNRQNVIEEFDHYYEHLKTKCIQNICYKFYRHGVGYIKFTIDLNGPEGPNVMGRDVFQFDMTSYSKNCYYGGSHHCLSAPHPYIEGSWSAFGRTIDGNCNKNSEGITCASKIIRDGWQIAPDYPW